MSVCFYNLFISISASLPFCLSVCLYQCLSSCLFLSHPFVFALTFFLHHSFILKYSFHCHLSVSSSHHLTTHCCSSFLTSPNSSSTLPLLYLPPSFYPSLPPSLEPNFGRLIISVTLLCINNNCSPKIR